MAITLVPNTEGFAVSGPLTFETVDEINTLAQPYFQNKKSLSIDLAQVTSSDSAALALLLDWLKLAKKLKFDCHFKNIPAKIDQIARLTGISVLITNNRT